MLTPALITSFNPSISLASPSVETMSDAELYAKVWPRNANVEIDLYLMMESDVAKWTEALKLPGPSTGSALEFLGKIARSNRRKEYWRYIAGTVTTNAARCGKKIVGITTFLPEINSKSKANQHGIATYAFASLLGIALEIEDLVADGRIPLVQSVAGSVIYDFKKHPVDYRIGMTREVLHAVRRSEEEIIRSLLSNLEASLVYVSKLYPGKVESVRIPLELEPGYLYAFASIETLCGIDSMIERSHTLIRSTVGYNLDIPHWMLSGDVTSSWVGGKAAAKSGFVSTESIRKRIFHSHISGHSRRGHFGDFPLSRLDVPTRRAEREELLGWLAQIDDLPNCKTVALEHEAALCMEDVQKSSATLCRWLDIVRERKRLKS